MITEILENSSSHDWQYRFQSNSAAVGGYVNPDNNYDDGVPPLDAGNFFRNGSQVVAPNDDKGYRLFQPGDSIRLISIGLIVPLSFELFKGLCRATLTWYNPANHNLFIVSELSGINSNAGGVVPWLDIPFVNSELIIDIPIEFPIIGNNRINAPLALNFGFDSINNLISMINVPASLNGQFFKIVPFIKIAHTLPMIAG